jgi:hypothetical protein
VTAAREHLGMAETGEPSDKVREDAVRDLTRHCGDGRLTLDELEQRIAEVYAASNVAEIEHALRELPKSTPAVRTPPPGPPLRTSPSAAPVRHSTAKGAEVALKAHLYTYLSVMAFLTLIWFLTSPFGYFWPIWPAMGWGLAVAIQAGVTKAAAGGDDHR